MTHGAQLTLTRLWLSNTISFFVLFWANETIGSINSHYSGKESALGLISKLLIEDLDYEQSLVNVLLENPLERTQRILNSTHACGGSWACERNMRSRESLVLLACHTRSHAYFSCFVAFFPMDFPAKERLLAVYSGHQNQQCLAALVGLGVSRGTMLSMERSKPADLVFRPASPHKPVSLTCCFFYKNV